MGDLFLYISQIIAMVMTMVLAHLVVITCEIKGWWKYSIYIGAALFIAWYMIVKPDG